MTVKIPTQPFDSTSLYRRTINGQFPLLMYNGVSTITMAQLRFTLQSYAPTVDSFTALTQDLDNLLPRPCLVTTVDGDSIPIAMFGEVLKVDSLNDHDLIEDFGNLIKQEVLAKHPSVQVDLFEITIQ